MSMGIGSGSSSGSGCDLTGINPESALICIGSDIGFNAQGTGLDDVVWSTSPSGSPATGEGAGFATHWESTGEKTVTANCGDSSREAAVTVVGVSDVISTPPIIRVHEKLRLAALPSPADAEFPEGGPEWSVEPAEGTTLTPTTGKTTDFSSTKKGTYTVTARCGTSSASCVVKVIQIDIVSGPAVITDTSQGTIVGKRVPLSVRITPDDPAIERSFDWTFPGKYVKGYTITESRGWVDHLTEVDSWRRDQTVYWIERLASPAENGDVTVKVEYGGRIFNLKTTFSVASPTGAMTSATTTLTPAVSIREIDGTDNLAFGDLLTSPGIRITGTVSGIVPTFSGHIALLQLVDTVETFDRAIGPDGSFSTGGYVLDNGLGLFYEGPNEIPFNHTTAMIGLLDSPGTPVTNTVQIKRSDSFKTYLMYKPAGEGNIWVTLSRLNWSWSGEATWSFTTGWTLGPQTHTQDPAGQDSSELPIWTKAWSELQ